VWLSDSPVARFGPNGSTVAIYEILAGKTLRITVANLMHYGIRSFQRSLLMTAVLASQWLLAPCFAQTPPRQLNPVSASSELDREPTSGLRLGPLQISFEESGLKEIGVKMHNVIIHHAWPQGEERGYSYLCFTAITDSRRERWWLLSDDFFGGGPDYPLTGVFAEQLAPSDTPTQDCPAPPPRFLAASFDNHVWLGSSSGDLKNAFGSEPPARGWFRYSHVKDEMDSNQGKPVDSQVSTWFDVKIAHGVVVAVRVLQMSST
jgi:hypothetical protein